MRQEKIGSSELVLNPDGSIYHLKLRPEHLADTVLLVGDQGRVREISKHFDTLEVEIQNREFVTHTGYIGQQRITAMSTGIGPDNIDIAVNELDALVNIDFENRIIRNEKKSLKLIRIGTSGTIQPDIVVDSVVVSSHGLGFDGLLQFYAHAQDQASTAFINAFHQNILWPAGAPRVYLFPADKELFSLLSPGHYWGITATAGGFYGPQGRILRLDCSVPSLNEALSNFNHPLGRITNFEMETSALYGLASLLGHRACTACAIIANRFTLTYSADYKKTVNRLIETVLQRITQ